MSEMTRRTLLRDGSLAATAATLLPAGLTNAAEAEVAEAAIFHVFVFHWKPETTEAQIDRATRDIRAFQGVIPGLLETHVGANLSPHAKGYTFGGIMQFKSKAALVAYVQHPAHQALLSWLVPLIEPIELDLYA